MVELFAADPVKGVTIGNIENLNEFRLVATLPHWCRGAVSVVVVLPESGLGKAQSGKVAPARPPTPS